MVAVKTELLSSSLQRALNSLCCLQSSISDNTMSTLRSDFDSVSHNTTNTINSDISRTGCHSFCQGPMVSSEQTSFAKVLTRFIMFVYLARSPPLRSVLCPLTLLAMFTNTHSRVSHCTLTCRVSLCLKQSAWECKEGHIYLCKIQTSVEQTHRARELNSSLYYTGLGAPVGVKKSVEGNFEFSHRVSEKVS